MAQSPCCKKKIYKDKIASERAKEREMMLTQEANWREKKEIHNTHSIIAESKNEMEKEKIIYL